MHKVLIVENNPIITKLLSHFFAAEGCDIRVAEDGLQAIITLDTFVPDILCTDIIMPNISGDQLCQIIRQAPQFKDIFIVVYSAIVLEDEKNLFAMEADLYIAKGSAVSIKQHVRYVIDQFNSGKRREDIVCGVEGLYPREITKELLLSKKHAQAIFENLAEAVIEMDHTGQIIQANQAAQVLLSRDLLTLLSSRLIDHLAGPDVNLIQQWFARVSNGQSPRFQSSSENPLLIGKRQILLNLVRVVEKKTFFIIAILQDITSLKETEAQLTKTINDLRAVIELKTVVQGLLFLDSNLRYRNANPTFRNMFGLSDELIAQKPTFREVISFNRHNGIYDVPEEEFDAYLDCREMEVRRGGCGPEEFRRKDGFVYQYQCVVLPDNGRMLTYFDITRHKKTEAELAKALSMVSDLANRDALTGLPNMRLFQERFLSTISISKRKGWKAAVMFLDLDNFKNVNDSLGHEAGDKVLKMVAQRLLQTVREADTVARIGGDEFLVIQTEVNDKAAAAHMAGKIVQQLAAPFNLDGNEIIIGASIGIAMYPTHGDNSEDLIRKADNAMYKTKTLDKRGYTFAPDA